MDVIREDVGLLSNERLQLLFNASVIGVVISTNTGPIREANDAFLRMVGYTREDLAAGRLDWRALTPPEWLPHDERAIREMAECGTFSQFEKEYIRKDGSRVSITLGGARLADRSDEQICYIVDLSAQREATRRLEESEHRYRILAEAIPQIIMVSDSERRLRFVNRYYEAYTGIPSAEIGARWAEAIHPDDLEAVRAVRATGGAYQIEYRLRRASDGAYRWHYARCQPIDDGGPANGWLAAAIDIDDRRRAEEALRFIERAGERLSQSLDLEATFETLFDLVVPAYADWAFVTMRDDGGGIQAVAARHSDPALGDTVRSLYGVDLLRSDSNPVLFDVYRTGEARIVTTLRPGDIASRVSEPLVEIVERLGYGSLAVLPIVADGEVIGVIGITSATERRIYTQADLPPLLELARRAGSAIANARRYAREHRVADLLQAAALPRALPAVNGFRFDAYYQAGRSEARIGGDWYDALVIADGRIVISVGDVAGSGLDAAVTMGNVRQVIRAAAHVDADPLLMLDVADRTLRSETVDPLVTAFVGVIDPVRRTLEYASAGHLPPLLRTPDGALVALSAAGAPLGCRELTKSESQTVALPPEATIVLFTDGLVEWDRDIVTGEDALRRAVEAGTALRGDHPARTLVEELLPPDGARDDVAVLTVAILPSHREGRSSP
jgi:PAS domain S-box-containing protein